MARLTDDYDVVRETAPTSVFHRLAQEEFEAVYVAAPQVDAVFPADQAVLHQRILESMADAVVLLDSDNTILWANRRLKEWTGRDDLIGANFYTVLGSPEILGPDFCPFHTALGHRQAQRLDAPLRRQPLLPGARRAADRAGSAAAATGRHRARRHDRGAAAAKAGRHPPGRRRTGRPDARRAAADVGRGAHRAAQVEHPALHQGPAALRRGRDPPARSQDRPKLEPLLAVGMDAEAEQRVLYRPAAEQRRDRLRGRHRQELPCEDTTEDPLYIKGAEGAKSSLTVPLVLHDEVIGTFNVESPEPRAFSESDLQFLEIFTRDVAVALNTLELLSAEKVSAAAASVEAIHSAVALPVDDILNDAVNVMERYIGHEPEVVERLHRILRNARDIKQVIQKVGQNDGAHARPCRRLRKPPERPRSRGRQVLVADADEAVRGAAHALLERYGCIVETAHDAAEAIYMVRNMNMAGGYDVIIADIRLPDMSGYDLLLKLQELMEPRAADPDDRLRLRSGPLDRQGPPGRLACRLGALQAVPPRPAPGDGRAGRHRRERAACFGVKLVVRSSAFRRFLNGVSA